MADLSTAPVMDGDRIRFKSYRGATSWLVRASTNNGRYTLCTAALFGTVHYTIIDWQEMVRGPMNVIGGGLGIDTLSGHDAKIDDAICRLQCTGDWRDEMPGYWEVSHRNQVPIRAIFVRPATVTRGWKPADLSAGGS